MSETSPSVLMKARPPSGGFTQQAGFAEEAESRAVSSSRLWLASGSSSSGMNAKPWNSPRTGSEAYQPEPMRPWQDVESAMFRGRGVALAFLLALAGALAPGGPARALGPNPGANFDCVEGSP